ncbi:hypothetical protein APY03_3111 [Variovorax sp. WDL1]|nr:hypothetical protein APY03_3111 [Variovorax sp. WDL1]
MKERPDLQPYRPRSARKRYASVSMHEVDTLRFTTQRLELARSLSPGNPPSRSGCGR